MGNSSAGAMVLVATLASCVVLSASVGVGLRVPTEETLTGVPRAPGLDYARFVGQLPRLSPTFIADSLGPGSWLTDPFVATGASPAPAGQPRGGQTAAPGPVRAVVEHPLTNDDFDDAYPIGSIPFTARTNSTGATREGEPRGCAPVGPTVWYRYRPEHDEGLVVSTIGTRHATGLDVYTGEDLAHLTQVSDACHSSVSGNAYVTFPARGATTYYFQVTSLAGSGPLVFNLDPSGTTEMVSLSLDGRHGNASSGFTVIAKGGRHVLFTSAASDLVPNDDNGVEDVFVRDLLTGTTELISVSSQGIQGNRESKPWPGAISADGRFVAFTSLASNLVPGDTNGADDVFVRDRLTGETTRVSVSSTGQQGEHPADPVSIGGRTAAEQSDDATWLGATSISADGRFVAFDSELVGLVPGDERGADTEGGLTGVDVFVHDRATGRTSLVSRSSEGANANDLSAFPDISADGRYVAFASSATNLIDGEVALDPYASRVKTSFDIYVFDVMASTTERVSLADSGERANGQSFAPSISRDGRYVAFASVATNLIGDQDTNRTIDVFVRDRRLGRTERVSVSSTGEQQIGADSTERTGINEPKPDMSWDGRYVVFTSSAINLVPRDTNSDSSSDEPKCGSSGEDVFVRDRVAGTTTRVSVSSSGTEGNAGSNVPSISADGRRVAFDSWASNLVEPGVDEPSDFGPVLCNSSDSFVHTFPALH